MHYHGGNDDAVVPGTNPYEAEGALASAHRMGTDRDVIEIPAESLIPCSCEQGERFIEKMGPESFRHFDVRLSAEERDKSATAALQRAIRTDPIGVLLSMLGDAVAAEPFIAEDEDHGGLL